MLEGNRRSASAFGRPVNYELTTVAHSTPFGLYRDGTELRGVYAGNHSVARAACQSLGRRCDYPILLGELRANVFRYIADLYRQGMTRITEVSVPPGQPYER